MTKFIFDLDGTVTKEETLPFIAKHFSVEEEIEKLTKQTVMGHIPFVESFIRRVFILGKLPIDEIDGLLADVALHEEVASFIRRHRENCAIATGNLSCWVAKLVERLGCEVYCSEGQIENNQVVKLTDILKKESVVEKYRAEGHRVVFIGDGETPGAHTERLPLFAPEIDVEADPHREQGKAQRQQQRAAGNRLPLADDEEDEADANPAGGEEEAVVKHRRQLAHEWCGAGIGNGMRHGFFPG